jgi:hypothetical protein
MAGLLRVGGLVKEGDCYFLTAAHADTSLIDSLRKAQRAYIERRQQIDAQGPGFGGSRQIGDAQALPGLDYRISYNGRVWLGEQLILFADGSEPEIRRQAG